MDIHSSSEENNSAFIYALQWQSTKHKNKQFLILKYIFMKNVFSYGQLYVALSEGISMKTIKVWIKLIGDKQVTFKLYNKILFIKKSFFWIYTSLTFKFLYFNLIILNFFHIYLILLHLEFCIFEFSTPKTYICNVYYNLELPLSFTSKFTCTTLFSLNLLFEKSCLPNMSIL